MKLHCMMSTLCVLVLGACDEFANGSISIATLQGTLSLADGMAPPEGELRLSILWNDYHANFSRQTAMCGESDLIGHYSQYQLIEQRLDQQLELDPGFPAAFSVKVTAPPPTAALTQCLSEHGARCAKGVLVVYRDVNGNGRLDPRSIHDKSPDEVLGSSQGSMPVRDEHDSQFEVVYVNRPIEMKEGSRTGEWGAGLLGYSQLITRASEPLPAVPETQPLDGTAKLDLTLRATPFVQRWMCEESCLLNQEMECPVDPADLLLENLGEAQPFIDPPDLVGRALWVRIDGERTITTTTDCERGQDDDGGKNAGREVFELARYVEDGCTKKAAGCHYERSQLPDGVDLPCTEYQVVSFGYPVPPPR